MTLSEIKTKASVVPVNVSGFNRKIDQYELGGQVIQVSETPPMQYRMSPIPSSSDEIVSCARAEWQSLEP